MLVSILYEELERGFDVIHRMLKQGRSVASHREVSRVRSILVTLEASLDLNVGGSLPETLASIYRAMRRELDMAARLGEAEKLEQLTQGVESLSSAWAGIRA